MLFTPVIGWRRSLDPMQQLMASYGTPGIYIRDFDPTRGRLFQDSAGTTPVTALADPIGMVGDDGPSGTTITQSTSGSRGTLRQVGSRYVWRGDGIDDCLLTNRVPATSLTYIVPVEANAMGDNIIGASNGAASRAWLIANVVNGFAAGGVGSQNNSTIFGGSSIIDVPGVIALTLDGVTVKLFWKAFGGSIAKIYEAAQSGAPTTAFGIALGAFNNAGTPTNPLDGDIYGAIVQHSCWTEADVSTAASFYSS